MLLWRSFFILAMVSFSLIEGAVCDVLDTISGRAAMSNSDTVVILHKGKILGSYGAEKQYMPIESRSVTKSFVSLAVGLLIQEGKIASIDTPVYYYFPEWKQGNRQLVTIRHLLSHTSGMAEQETCDVDTYPDIVRQALSTDFNACPGSRFIYNNKAVNLLAGIVGKAAGMNVQQYLKKSLFNALGITSDTWICDSVGNCFGMSHLSINAVDLAKVGMLVMQQGFWNGIPLLSKDWIDLMMGPSQCNNPFYSVLWWLDYDSIKFHWDDDLIDLYASAGVPPEFLKPLRALEGCVVVLEGRIGYKNYAERAATQLAPYFSNIQDIYNLFAYIECLGLPIARWEGAKVRSVSARGFGGQQLIVLPAYDLIAVRLSSRCGKINAELDTFPDLEVLLGQLGEELKQVGYQVTNYYTPPPQMPPPKCYDYRTDPEFQCVAPCGCPPEATTAEIPYCTIETTCLEDLPYFTPAERTICPEIPYYYSPTSEGQYHFNSSFEGSNKASNKAAGDAQSASPEPKTMEKASEPVNQTRDHINDIYIDNFESKAHHS